MAGYGGQQQGGYGGQQQGGYRGPPQGYGGQPQMAPQGYGGPPSQQQQQQRPGSSYQKRASAGGFVAGSTMGPAGTVDFASLARGGGGMWSDPDFRPNDSALWIDPRQPGGGAIGGILSVTISWKRAHELAQANVRGGKAALFYDDAEDESGDGGAEANDIIQGTLGDCYFLSSLAILCTSKGLGLVEKLFVSQEYFDQGLVGLRFFKEGQWMDVAVDTFLPCSGNTPVFARCVERKTRSSVMHLQQACPDIRTVIHNTHSFLPDIAYSRFSQRVLAKNGNNDALQMQRSLQDLGLVCYILESRSRALIWLLLLMQEQGPNRVLDEFVGKRVCQGPWILRVPRRWLHERVARRPHRCRTRQCPDPRSFRVVHGEWSPQQG